jgi:formimidoylglutamate deiminase
MPASLSGCRDFEPNDIVAQVVYTTSAESLRTVKTVFAKHARLPAGWARDVEIDIDDAGRIAAVRSGAPVPPGAEVVRRLVPGIPNVHSHAFQRVLAGYTETSIPGENSFWTWRERMYACVERLGPDELEAIATHLYVELLQSGYTSVAEFHYLHRTDGSGADLAATSHALMRAARTAGIRLLLLPTLYMHGGFGGQPVVEQQRRFQMSVDEYLGLLDELRAAVAQNIGVGTAFHSLRAVSPDAIARVLDHHERHHVKGPIHVHAAEQRREVDDCVAWSGMQPVEWLLEYARVDARWCILHATHMRPQETRRLAESGAVVGLCPTTEANLGDGLFSLPEYLAAGGRIAIGSDSHVCVDPREELRWLEYGQRLVRRRRNVAGSTAQPHTGARLFFAVLEGGARAFGQPLGRIAPRHCADLIAIDDGHPLLAGCEDDELFDRLVFAGHDNPVTDVMVGGNWVVRDREHRVREQAAVAFAATRARLTGEARE